MGGAGSAAATLALTLVATAARGAVLLAAAWLAVRLLRRPSASLRHAVWAAALGAHLVLPALSMALPGWRLTTPAGTPAVLRSVIAGVAPVSSVPSPGAAGPAARVRLWRADADAITGAWMTGWIAVWAAGVGVLLVRRAAAARALGRLAREAHPLTDDGWRHVAGAAAADVGLRRPVTLLRGTALTVPVTWGTRRPVVLLSHDADAWGEARRRLVLLHELAHAARGDVLVLHLAQLVTAAFWFDPLVWLAARRLKAEAERAADDAVLRAGIAPSAYVAELVEIIRTRPMPPAHVLALVAGRGARSQSAFERRMSGVLDAAADRRALSGRAAALLATGALACATPLAAVRHTGRPVAPVPTAPGHTARSTAPAVASAAPPRTPASPMRAERTSASHPSRPGGAKAAAPRARIAPAPPPAAARLQAGAPAPPPRATATDMLAPPGVGRTAAAAPGESAPGEGSRPMPVAVPVEVPVEVPVVVPPAERGDVLPPIRVDLRLDVGRPSVPPLR